MEHQASAQADTRVVVRRICSLGDRLIRTKRFDDAIAAFEAALAIDPGCADAHNGLGVAHHSAGRVEEGMAAYRRAVEIDPGNVKAHSNLGTAFMERNAPDLAIAAYERALATNPINPTVRTFLAFAQLLSGDLPAGWRNYESRWAAGAAGNRRPFLRKPWLGGRSLAGRSILLCSEQGYGDMIQFARFVPLVASLGARVHLEAKQPLQRLFQASFPQLAAFHVVGEAAPRCEEYCTVPGLALAFGTGLSTIPAGVPYLTAPAAARLAWSDVQFPPGVPRIGIAWAGAATHQNDSKRSIPFAQFRGILAGGDVSAVCLQTEVRESDRQALAATPAVLDLSGRLRDFADTAALIEKLDLIIAVDTAAAHLAGALGRAVWVLLPFAPDWRWMLDRVDSPWYPSMRLFRQPSAGDWDSVIAAVRRELQVRFAPR
jgi:hypothetical protein